MNEKKEIKIQKVDDTEPQSWQGCQISTSKRWDINLYQKKPQGIKEKVGNLQDVKKIHPEGYIDNHGHTKQYVSAMRRLNSGETPLLPENKQDLIDFISDAELGKTIKQGKKKKIGQARVVKYIEDLTKLDSFVKKPFANITQREMESFIVNLENGKILSKRGHPFMPETIITTKNVIKKFYKWKLGEGKFFPEIVDWFDTSLEIPEYKAIKKDQIDVALATINSNNTQNLTRNKALIGVLFDSGARVDELLNVRLKHLTEEKGHYKLRIEFSKTKKRTIGLPLYKSYIDAWLDIHPNRHPEAQLFPFGYQCLRKVLSRIGKQLRIGRLTPHSFRHGSITYYANLKIFSDQQLKYRYGWSANSKQLSRYIDQEGLNQEEAVSQVSLMQEQKEVDKLASENKMLNQRLAIIEEQMERLFAQDKEELKKIINKVSALEKMN